ncbi:hypothetical protein ACHHYP_07711 [Achlya hypogyna]|uniref:Uncharacterized protein n=1 Tax=Achlya hypogyna TaxID=1202772 RepID=A0A1V9YQH1_ACHHY|nr:hypothetical protein ACHHYP_07711 [Achlya hypogyna]
MNQDMKHVLWHNLGLSASSGESSDLFQWFKFWSSSSPSVPYIQPTELLQYSNMTLAQHWMGRTRSSIHPDYQAAYDMIALVPEILERSASLVAMTILDECLLTAPMTHNFQTILSTFVARYCLPQHIERSLSNLHTFSSRYGWSKYVAAALREVTTHYESNDHITAVMHEIHEFMKMCAMAKIEAFAKLLDLVAARDDCITDGTTATGPVEQVAAAAARLRAPMLRAMIARRDQTFDTVFIKPADLLLRSGRWCHAAQQRADDLRIHGSNMYRALLLSTLGINAWDTPNMHEHSHFAPDFLEYLRPDEAPLKDLWHPRTRSSSIQALHLQKQVNLERAFIVHDDRPNGDVANHLIGPYSSTKERTRVAQYLEAYAGYFTRQELDIILVNKLIGDPEGATSDDLKQRATDRKTVLKALQALGVAAPDEEDMICFLYNDEYAIRTDNVDALMQFLGIYKPTRQDSAPLQKVKLVSPYVKAAA